MTFSFRPFVFHVAKGREVLHRADVFFDTTEWTTQGSVDSIFGQQDSPAQSESLAESLLPQPNSVGISQRSEFVEEDDLAWVDRSILSAKSGGAFPTTKR